MSMCLRYTEGILFWKPPLISTPYAWLGCCCLLCELPLWRGPVCTSGKALQARSFHLYVCSCSREHPWKRTKAFYENKQIMNWGLTSGSSYSLLSPSVQWVWVDQAGWHGQSFSVLGIVLTARWSPLAPKACSLVWVELKPLTKV